MTGLIGKWCDRFPYHDTGASS